MLLTVDVGNTDSKFGVFDGEKLVAAVRINTQGARTSDERGLEICNLLAQKKVDRKNIDSAIISSVVPKVMHSLTNAIIKYFNATPMILGPGTKTGIQLIRTNPAEVGSDRLADGVAALALFGGPVIVADYGTATKFDYFSKDKVFAGAVTCPGIGLSARALWEGTAKLPEIEIKNPGTVLCQNTVSSLQAGILYGKVGEAEYIIDKIKAETKERDIKVVATGGLSSVIYNETDRFDYLEPNLTMIGLRLIYEKNKA